LRAQRQDQQRARVLDAVATLSTGLATFAKSGVDGDVPGMTSARLDVQSAAQRLRLEVVAKHEEFCALVLVACAMATEGVLNALARHGVGTEADDAAMKLSTLTNLVTDWTVAKRRSGRRRAVAELRAFVAQFP